LLGIGAGGGGRQYRREQEAIGRTVDPDPSRRSQVETCLQEVRRLWRSPGFLAPDPEPPFVIGVSGRKMAELAGRLADGLNLRATHPRLGELVELAREAHARSGRGSEPLLVTVHAAFDEHWHAAESAARAGLDEVGADRLILTVTPPYDRRGIARAGRLLDGLA
jgi:alkanesulfonate monooxygenase SsuD/methylene tetrahydromethanopterin reductase-like flavin-dependent oxidoreductase (luciferase family)